MIQLALSNRQRRASGLVRANATDAVAADAGAAQATAQFAPVWLSFSRDPLRIAMFLLTVMNISRVHEQYPILMKMRPGVLLVLATATYAFLNRRLLTQANIFGYWPPRAVAGLVLLACFSAAFGISLGGSASFILNEYSRTLVYFVLLALSIRGVRDLYMMTWAVALSCGILTFFALFVFQLQGSADGMQRLSNLHTYDANDVCVVLLFGLGAVLLLLQVEKGWRRLLLLVMVVGVGASIARSGSRGGFLGLVAFGLASLVLVNTVSVGRRVMLLIAVVIGVALFAPPGYWKQMQTILAPAEDYNFSSKDGRKQLIIRGLKYMSAYPVFGVGIGNFSKAECDPALSGEETGRLGVRCGAAHNSYIQAGAETGPLGLLLWLSICPGGILLLIRLRRRLPPGWRRGNETQRFLYGASSFFAVGLFGFAASAFFVSFAWTELVYIQAAFMTGLFVSVRAYRIALSTAPPSSAAVGAVAPVPSRRAPGWRVRLSMHRVAQQRGHGIGPSSA